MFSFYLIIIVWLLVNWGESLVVECLALLVVPQMMVVSSQPTFPLPHHLTVPFLKKLLHAVSETKLVLLKTGSELSNPPVLQKEFSAIYTKFCAVYTNLKKEVRFDFVFKLIRKLVHSYSLM